MYDSERERIHRFTKEAHELLRHRSLPYLNALRPLEVGTKRRASDEDLELAYATTLRVLRLLEYAMADTELIPDQGFLPPHG